MVSNIQVPTAVSKFERNQRQFHVRLCLDVNKINFSTIEKSKYFKEKSNDQSGPKYLFTSNPDENFAILDGNSGVFEIVYSSAQNETMFDRTVLDVVREMVATFYEGDQLVKGGNYIAFKTAPKINDLEKTYSLVVAPFLTISRPVLGFQSSISSASYTVPNKPYTFELVYKVSPTLFFIEFYAGINPENPVNIDILDEMHDEMLKHFVYYYNLIEKEQQQ
ncbi:MAG: hypothetical protein QXF12_02145 [Candidatus Aenigmatarchaeota archaeon]